MTIKKEKIIRAYVGELPLIRNVAYRLGLKEILSEHIKSHGNEYIPAVDTLMMLLFNITCGRQPLYELEEWVGRIDPKIFGCTIGKKGMMNDDRFGRALDKLYWADRATMMTDIVITMIEMTDLDLSRIHNDSTTVKAYGKIPGRTRTGLKLARGISKDYRPDLKQLVYSLTVSSDGAVPIHYKTYSGNRTDDKTHIETWKTLVRIVGNPSFLYVADCKVCTEEQLSYIVFHGGRVVTIIPETWKEVKYFKIALRKKRKHRTVIWRRKVPGSTNQYEYFSSYTGRHHTIKGSYNIHWIFSSEKMKRDRKSRAEALRKTEQELSELSGRLNTRNLKTREEILDRVQEILRKRDVEGLFHISLSTIIEKYRQQVGSGRPGPKTKFKIITEMVYALSYVRNQKALREEHNVDGIFPLLSTDINLTAKDALIAYKYQPRLEKRFTQFKGVHHAAPLLFKKIERVEAIMFLFFLALMIQAILERELRQNMKARCIDAIPIYPEHRIAYHPTTAKLFDRFEDVSVYQLRKGSNVKLFQDELTKFQKELLEMLDMKESEYWSENYV